MKIIGIQLRSPRLSDLPLVIFCMAFPAAHVCISMLAFDQDIRQSISVIMGFSATAIAIACGVDFRSNLFRGLFLVLIIMLFLAVPAVALDILLN